MVLTSFGGCSHLVLLHVLCVPILMNTFQATLGTTEAAKCNFLCSDGTCVASKYVLCPNGCFHFQQKCSNGQCIGNFLNCPDSVTPSPGDKCRPFLKCEGGTCADSQFQRCPNGCFPTKKKCADGSCRYFCPLYTTTTSTVKPCKYVCPDGKCLASRYLLCSNGCRPDQYKCPSGRCEASVDRCDCPSNKYCKAGGCMKGNDRKSCALSSKNCPYKWKFDCEDGRVCIASKLKCDGKEDCKYGTDERDCDTAVEEDNGKIYYAVLIPIGAVILVGVCCFCYRKSKSSADNTEEASASRTGHRPTGTMMHQHQPTVAGASPNTENYNGHSNMPPPRTTTPLLPPDGTADPSAPPPAYTEAVQDRYKVPIQDSTDAHLPSYDSVAHVEPSAPPQE